MTVPEQGFGMLKAAIRVTAEELGVDPLTRSVLADMVARNLASVGYYVFPATEMEPPPRMKPDLRVVGGTEHEDEPL